MKLVQSFEPKQMYHMQFLTERLYFKTMDDNWLSIKLFGVFLSFINGNTCNDSLVGQLLRFVIIILILKADREIGTEDKLIACACEDGCLRVVALRSRMNIFEFRCESAVNCCCFLGETQVACGTQNGFIYILDIENRT